MNRVLFSSKICILLMLIICASCNKEEYEMNQNDHINNGKTKVSFSLDFGNTRAMNDIKINEAWLLTLKEEPYIDDRGDSWDDFKLIKVTRLELDGDLQPTNINTISVDNGRKLFIVTVNFNPVTMMLVDSKGVPYTYYSFTLRDERINNTSSIVETTNFDNPNIIYSACTTCDLDGSNKAIKFKMNCFYNKFVLQYEPPKTLIEQWQKPYNLVSSYPDPIPINTQQEMTYNLYNIPQYVKALYYDFAGKHNCEVPVGQFTNGFVKYSYKFLSVNGAQSKTIYVPAYYHETNDYDCFMKFEALLTIKYDLLLGEGDFKIAKKSPYAIGYYPKDYVPYSKVWYNWLYDYDPGAGWDPTENVPIVRTRLVTTGSSKIEGGHIFNVKVAGNFTKALSPKLDYTWNHILY